MKFTNWPYRATFQLLRFVEDPKNDCHDMLEATLDRLVLAGYLPSNRQNVSIEDLTLPKGDEWLSNFYAKSQIGKSSVSVYIVNSEDAGIITVLGMTDEIVKMIKIPHLFQFIEIFLS